MYSSGIRCLCGHEKAKTKKYNSLLPKYSVEHNIIYCNNMVRSNINFIEMRNEGNMKTKNLYRISYLIESDQKYFRLAQLLYLLWLLYIASDWAMLLIGLN